MNDPLEKEFPELARELAQPTVVLHFDKEPISLKRMKLIHKCLQNNTTVTILTLRECGIGDEHCKIIADLLKDNSRIRILKLRKNPIGADGINALASGLKQNRSVEALTFGEIQPTGHGTLSENETLLNFTKATMESLGLLLSSADCWVERLTLLDYLIQTGGAKYLGKALALNKHLTRLNLYDCVLRERGCEEICEGLKNNSTLTELGLHNCGIGPQGGRSLANVLSSPTCSLESLCISINPIEDGMRAIFESLVGNSKLRKLSMDGTGGKTNCFKQLGDLFQKNKTLSTIYSYDKLGENILLLIANALKNNTTFKLLHLGSCGLTHLSLTKILQALTTNTTLTNLSLSDSLDLPYQGLEHLVEAIQSNTTLRELALHLKLEGNHDQIMNLQKAVKINHSLSLFYLGLQLFVCSS